MTQDGFAADGAAIEPDLAPAGERAEHKLAVFQAESANFWSRID